MRRKGSRATLRGVTESPRVLKNNGTGGTSKKKKENSIPVDTRRSKLLRMLINKNVDNIVLKQFHSGVLNAIYGTTFLQQVFT